MKTYRILWLSLCFPVGVIGAAVGVVLSSAAVAFLFVVSGVFGSLLTLCLAKAFWRRGARGRLRLLAGSALVAGFSGGAFVAYASLLGPGVLLLAVGVLASSPYAVTTYRRWLSSVRAPWASQLDAVVRALAYASPESAQFHPLPQLRDLTDEQLCNRWRTSYRATRRRSSAARLSADTAERQVYLDELEHRNARGFAAWLVAGPEAAENPLPYLTGDHFGAVPPVDWDELTRGHG